MANNAIASGAVTLTANADGLASGLDKGAKQVQSWGTKVGASLTNLFNSKGGTLGALQNIGGAVTSKLAGLASAAKGLLSGAGTAIGTMIGGPIGGAIGSAVGSAVGTIGETIVGALASPFEKLDLFADINKQAKSLGVSASQFQGLTVVMGKAGIQGEQVGQVFAQMGKQISDVAAGKGKGATLAFEKLGLNAQELMALKPDKQFMAIADAFQKMGPGADSASAAVHLFGGNAAGLLPELQKGSAGIQGLIDSMKKTGAVLSDDQLQAAANAARAWKDAKVSIKSAWDGLVNRATLIAAPVIQFVGKAVTKIFGMLQPVFEWFGRAVGKVADIATAVFEQLEKWFGEAVKWIQNVGGELFGFAGEWPTVEEVIVDVFRAVGTAAAYAWDTIKVGGGAIEYTAGLIVEAFGTVVKVFKDVVSLAKELPDELRPKGLDAFIAGVDRFKAGVGNTAQKLKDMGKANVDSFGDSAKQFNAWLDKALIKKKKLDEGTLNADMTGPGFDATPKLAGALAKGSKEAYSMILKNDLSGKFPGMDIGKQQLKAQKDGNKKLDKIGDHTKAAADKLGELGVT